MKEAENTPVDTGAANEAQIEQKEKPGKKLGCCGMFALTLLALVVLGAFFMLWWVSRVNDAQEEFVRQVEDELVAEQDSIIRVAPEDDAAPLYGRAWLLYVAPVDQDNLYSVKNMHKAKPADIDKYMADNAACLATLKKAMLKPGCSMQVDLSKGILASLPNTHKFRESVRFLTVAARYEAGKGNSEEALRLLGICLRLSRDAGANRLLLPRMVQVACEAITVSALEHVLSECNPSEAELRSFLAALDAHIKSRPPMAEVFGREKILMTVTVKDLVTGKLDPSAAMGVTPSGGSQLGVGAWRASGLLLKEARNLARVMDRQAEAARKPFPESLAEMEKIEKEIFPSSGGSRQGLMILLEGRLWINQLLPSSGRLLISEARTVAKLDLARLAIACRLHKLKTGAYPASLADLSKSYPKEFAKLPLDPFSAQDMKYKRTEAGCKLWSLDSNRIDEGGLKRTHKNRYACDIVFELKK